MITKDEITYEDVCYKTELIRNILGIANKQIAKRLHVDPARLGLWMRGGEIVPQAHYENLCKIADFATYREEYYRKLRKNESTYRIPITTANYIDKQVGMKKYRMGETILANLAKGPRTIHELQYTIKNRHRQAVSRKIQEMEDREAISCERWMGHYVLCRLRAGVKTYLREVHWRKTV